MDLQTIVLVVAYLVVAFLVATFLRFAYLAKVESPSRLFTGALLLGLVWPAATVAAFVVLMLSMMDDL